MFNIGDKIKLKNYGPYEDYVKHINQTASIVPHDPLELDSYFDYRILWNDGDVSLAESDNIINFTAREWDEIEN